MSKLSSWLKKQAGIPETRLKVSDKAMADLEDKFVKQLKLYGVPEVSAQTLFKWIAKELGVATLLLLCLTGAGAAVLNVATGGDYAVQAAKALPGDALKLAADITLPGDNALPEGVTLDLNGKTVTFPGKRGFWMRSGSRITNGTIAGALWGAATAAETKDVQVTKVFFKDVTGAALKFAGGTAPTDGILVEDVRVTAVGAPQTLFDFGPGPTSGVSIRRCYIKGIENPVNNTACDGIAIENGTTVTVIEDTTVDGVGGDGIDVKGKAALKNVLILNAVRNSVKLWRGGTMERVSVVGSGFGAVNTQPVTATDCYFEAGKSGGTAWTVDDQGVGVPHSTFVRCAFTRKPGGAGGTLMASDSTPDISYEDCTFWNGPVEKPYYPNVYIGKWSVVISGGKITPFPSAWVRPLYKDAEPPEGVGYGTVSEPPVDPPPPPPPPAVYATKDEVTAQKAALDAADAALAARLAELEAVLAKLRAALN